MIFKLEIEEKTEYATSKNLLHLLKEYDNEYECFQDIINVTELSESEAKNIYIQNLDFNENDPESIPEMRLYDLAVGVEFCIIGLWV